MAKASAKVRFSSPLLSTMESTKGYEPLDVCSIHAGGAIY